MALITCPECGQQVSEHASKCIHCGYEFSSQPQNKLPDEAPVARKMSELSLDEQQALKAEFEKAHPRLCSRKQKISKASRLLLIPAISLFFVGDSESKAYRTFTIIAIFINIIVFTVLSITYSVAILDGGRHVVMGGKFFYSFKPYIASLVCVVIYLGEAIADTIIISKFSKKLKLG